MLVDGIQIEIRENEEIKPGDIFLAIHDKNGKLVDAIKVINCNPSPI